VHVSLTTLENAVTCEIMFVLLLMIVRTSSVMCGTSSSALTDRRPFWTREVFQLSRMYELLSAHTWLYLGV
jgi:hypothetical protein